MTTVQQRIAKMLGKRESLSAAQCAAGMTEIDARVNVIRARLDDIRREPNGWGELAPARKAAIENGRIEDLDALDKEQRRLEAEEQVLAGQYTVIEKQQERATVEEAPPRAAKAIKQMKPLLEAAEATAEAHKNAIAELDAARLELLSARSIADINNIEAPRLGSDEFDRLARLLDWNYNPLPKVTEGNMNVAKRRRRNQLCGRVIPEPNKITWIKGRLVQTPSRLSR